MGNPEIIIEFPTQESLKHRGQFQPDSNKLYEEQVDEDYIAISQRPDLVQDPNWRSSVDKKPLIEQYGVRILRPYQLQAIRALQSSAKEGNKRFLFEMATGTGKTLISSAVIKLFLRTGKCQKDFCF